MLFVYCAVSVLLLLNIDVSALALPSKSSSSACLSPSRCLSFMGNGGGGGGNNTSMSSSSSLRVSTIVMHCLFVGMLLQIPVGSLDQSFMMPWKVMLRSFLFVVLAICWTYSVGIHETFVHMREYPYFYNPVLQGKFVQPFTPCQLRFVALLFLDGWFLFGTSLAMILIVGRQVSLLASQFSSSFSPSNNAEVPGSNNDTVISMDSSSICTHNGSSGSKNNAQDLLVTTAGMLPPPTAALVVPTQPLLSHHSALKQDIIPVPNGLHQQQQKGQLNVSHHHHHPPPPANSAQQQFSVDGRTEEGVMVVGKDEDETVAMFRMARRAASSRLGEQI